MRLSREFDGGNSSILLWLGIIRAATTALASLGANELLQHKDKQGATRKSSYKLENGLGSDESQKLRRPPRSPCRGPFVASAPSFNPITIISKNFLV